MRFFLSVFFVILVLFPSNNVFAVAETLFLVGFDKTFQDFSKNDSKYINGNYQIDDNFLKNETLDKRQEYTKFGEGSLRVYGWQDAKDGKFLETKISFLPKEDIDVGTSEFTIDFWVYPLGLPFIDITKDKENGKFFELLNTRKNSSGTYPNSNLTISRDKDTTRGSNKPYLLFTEDKITADGTAIAEELLKAQAGNDVIPGRWNHVAVQRKNTGADSKFTVAVNGKVGSATSKPLSFKIPPMNRAIFSKLSNVVYGFLDEVRVVKGEALWAGGEAGKTFDIGSITSSITPAMKGRAKAFMPSSKILPADTLPSFVIPFDDSLTASQGGTVTVVDSKVPLPAVVSDEDTQAGNGSAYFAGERNGLVYTAPANEIDLGGGDFTVDFWVKPDSLSSGSGGESLQLFSLKDSANKTFLLQRHNYTGGLKTLAFGPVNEPSFDPPYSLGADVSPTFNPKFPWWVDIEAGRWNHIVVQKEGIGLRLMVNGIVGGGAFHIPLTGKTTLTIGGVTAASTIGGKTYPFKGYIDHFRITKGALWQGVSRGDKIEYVGPKGSAPVTIEPPVDKDPNVNRVEVPGKEGVPSFPALSSRETADDGKIPERATSKELLIQNLDGSRDYTNYYDDRGVLIKSVFWAENTGDKKMKLLEYDATGELRKETYFGPKGEVTDAYFYYPTAEGGSLHKEIIRRGDKEIYTRFSPQGNIVYAHEVKAGKYVYSKHITYEANGKVKDDLMLYTADRFEKNIYITSEQTGQVREIRNYQRVPTPDGASYVYTVTALENGKMTSKKTLYADNSFNLQKTVLSTFDASGEHLTVERTFDYANNLQQYLEYHTKVAKIIGKKAFEYAWNISDGAYRYKTSYDYKGLAGTFEAKNKKIAGSDQLLHYVDDDEEIDTDTTFTFQSVDGVVSWKDMTKKSYDKDGNLFRVTITTFKEKPAYMVDTVNSYHGDYYDGNQSKYSTSRFNNGARVSTEYYDSAGNVFFKNKYQNNASGGYVAKGYYILGASEIPAGEQEYSADGSLINDAKKEELAMKNYGDALLDSLGVSMTGVNASTEKAKLLEVSKKIIGGYKEAISNPSIAGSKQKKYRIYADFVNKLTAGVFAVEHAVWGADPGKSLVNDHQLESTAKPWMGVDVSSGQEFFGIYIMPGRASPASSDAVFIDMDINNPAVLATVLGASSFDALKTISKKKEKWDSLSTLPSMVYGPAGTTFYSYNLRANNGTGAYLSLQELTKADPTINLLLDRMQKDLGTSLNPSLSDEAVIRTFYEYFLETRLFNYMYDLGDVSQTVNETLTRGGGDCEDFGIFAASLLRNLFLRLGKTDSADRVGLGIVQVDSFGKISSKNAGAGHGSLMFKAKNGSYYYIEASYLFNGSSEDRTFDLGKILTVLAPGVGGAGAKTGKVETVPDGWYVEALTFNPINGATEVFTASQPFTTQKIAPSPVGKSATEKISTLPTYIEPYNRKVNALADSIIRYIPQFKDKTPEYLAEYVNMVMKEYSVYRADGRGDTWARVDVTLSSLESIQGDCEDLAFVEASLLQNILTKYYMVRGDLLVNAALRAQDHVMVVAQNNYGGVMGKAHLLVGLVSPRADSALTTVRLMDPQTGVMDESKQFSTLFTDQYLFFANTNKITTITYYDWSTLNLSSSVKKDGGGNKKAEKVKPVAPEGTSKLSDAEIDQALTKIENKLQNGEPLTEAEVGIFNAATAKVADALNGGDGIIDNLNATTNKAEVTLKEKMATNEAKVAEIAEKVEQGKISDINTKADGAALSNAQAKIKASQNTLHDASLFAAPETFPPIDLNGDYVMYDAQPFPPIDLNGNYVIMDAEPSLPINLIFKDSDSTTLFDWNYDPSPGEPAPRPEVALPGSAPDAPPPGFKIDTKIPDSKLAPDPIVNPFQSFVSAVAKVYVPPAPIFAGPGISNNMLTIVNPLTGQITYFTPVLGSRLNQSCPDGNTVTKLCSDVPASARVTTKPENSYFVGRDNCASNANICSDDTTFNTGWQCNPGFINARGKCIKINIQEIDACPNIAGVQATIPAGLIKDAAGNCVLPKTDITEDRCVNIPGIQAIVPEGMTRDTSDRCDICPNIPDAQIEIPAGMSKDAAGNCVFPSVSATVSLGSCVPATNLTPANVSIAPDKKAKLVIRTASSLISELSSNGQVNLPPGSYAWIATPESGYVFSPSAPTSGTLTARDCTPTICTTCGPKFSISGPSSISEGNAGTKEATYTVSLSEIMAQVGMIDYRTSDGTASAGSDYTTVTGRLTFNPGEQRKEIKVSVLGDTVDEQNETFKVTLSGPLNAAIGSGEVETTIIDDDGGGITIIGDTDVCPNIDGTQTSIPTDKIKDANGNCVDKGGIGSTPANLFIAGGSAAEGSAVTFTVRLSKPLSSPITFSYATSDGTAKAATDYTAKTGILTIVAGADFVQLPVQTIADNIYEPDPKETFFVTISSPSSGATITTNKATGEISDDDIQSVICNVYGTNAYTTPITTTFINREVYWRAITSPASRPVTSVSWIGGPDTINDKITGGLNAAMKKYTTAGNKTAKVVINNKIWDLPNPCPILRAIDPSYDEF